jgi:nitroreductase
MDALDAIRARRSVGRLGEPAPTAADVEVLLEAAQAAPDHGRLRPWRFVVLDGPAKDDFGKVLARAFEARCAAAGVEPDPAERERERRKFDRAPMIVVVAAAPVESAKVPWVEQVLAAGAAAQNILIAATALGYGSMWRTGEPAYDPLVKRALGLGEGDAIVAFLYLGTPLPT